MLDGQMLCGIKFFGVMKPRLSQGDTKRYGLLGKKGKRRFIILIVLSQKFNVRLGGCSGGV
jgi:hypothetical protein